MIVTRTIPVSTLNIAAFVIEMRLSFPVKFFDLIEFRDDGAIDNFKIDVDATWNAADDLALDALIAGHNPATPRLTLAQDRYKFYPITVPFATNNNAFQLAFSQNFTASPTWTFELTFFLQITCPNQQSEFELRLNGIPFIIGNFITHPNAADIRPYSGAGPLQNLLLGTNTIDVYIRKVVGAGLITLQGGLITTKRFLV